jgi:DNA repair exonuclease SbcCD ATPase subunit
VRILKLVAENIKRLSVVEIQPDGSPVIVIGGENEAGKSSVLDAIAMALGGKDLVPSKPIRKGQSRASVKVDLGDYVVTRTFTETGSSLTVTNRDGLKYPSPQALLDGLVGKLTFDPLAFAEMDETTQANTLRRLAGIDTSDLDADYKRVYDERTLVNRDVRQLEGALAKAPEHADVGVELVSATLIATELEEADTRAAEASRQEIEARGRALTLDQANNAVKAREADLARAREAVNAAELALNAAELALFDAEQAAQRAMADWEWSRDATQLALKKVPDRTILRARMATVEATNAKVRDNQARAKVAEQLAGRKVEVGRLTTQLNRIESQKAERLEQATFPVKGLGLDDAGNVTWNGLPFSQASSAIRIRASVAIAAALNPKLRICLIRNGNDLGQRNLQLLAESAGEHGFQLWVERIAGGDGQATVMIEDGAVVEQAVVR